jgi:hypothetical protein
MSNEENQAVESNEPAQSQEMAAGAEQKAVEMVNMSMEVPKQLNDFANGLAELFAAIKGNLADGFQPGQDLPVLITQAIAKLGPIVNSAQGILPAFKEHPLSAGVVIAVALEKALK